MAHDAKRRSYHPVDFLVEEKERKTLARTENDDTVPHLINQL